MSLWDIDARIEELVNAINNQNKTQTIGVKESEVIKNLCKKKGLDVAQTFPNGIMNLTNEQYVEAIKKLEGLKSK